MKPLIESASGIRGIIGHNLDPRIATKVGMAFGSFLGKGTVIVGGDTRTSHDMIKHALVSGLMAVGVDVIDIGFVPTPTVQQMIRHHGAKGGVVVTASHNPIIWNGLKLMNDSGSFLDDSQYDQFVGYYRQDVFKLASWDGLGSCQLDTQALKVHIDHLLTQVDTRLIQGASLTVIVDPNNGAGALAVPLLLDRLGVRYDLLNGAPDGHFAHDPEPLQKNVQGIMTAMQQGGYDIGFVQDADADRLVILDENGVFIGEDYSLAFCMDYVLSACQEEEKQAVVNLSTSKVIEFICRKHKTTLHYTKIGETHVTQGIKQYQAVAGG